MGLFSKDIGIDLGTASVLVYIKGKGVVLREPSVVAMDKNTGKLLKVGTEAEAMLGRTPGNIVAMRPLRDGVISDYDMTERMLKEFIKKVKKGDIVVAQKNFGCGSSREHAPIAIKACGVSCVIAETFARIFYRNAINIGLPIIECPEAAKDIEAGDEVEVDFDTGIIYDHTKGTQYQGQAFPEFMQKIIRAEGLINYINSQQ